VRLVVLAIVEFDNVFLDDKFKQSREYVSTEIVSEGLHDQKNLDSSRNEFGDN
jgi:hypothetical protein